MHVFVTGGAGFIGSHIAEYHLKQGHKVLVVDDLSTGSMENIELLKTYPTFEFEKADIVEWEGLKDAVHWADRVYHMAAVVGMFRVLSDPLSVLTTNISGCERVLRAASTCRFQPELLVASTSSVYGLDPKIPHEEEDKLIYRSLNESYWSYAISKLADEAFCQAFARKKDVKVSIVRFFNMTGPRQTGLYGMVVPRFVKQAAKGEPISVYGNGTQTRSFCDVRDCVVMLDLLIKNKKSIGEIVNVGSDREICINDLAALVNTIAQKDTPIEHIPYKEAYGDCGYHDILRRKPELKKLKGLIDYTPKYQLEDTIRDLLDIELKRS